MVSAEDTSKVVILVNVDANNKKAGKKWNSISRSVLAKLPKGTQVVEYRIPFDICACLHDQVIQKKANCIISAGGDGSANIILNEIVRLQKAHNLSVRLGFIGLGSSNDLLKPNRNFIENIPVQIDFLSLVRADIGVASILKPDNSLTERYFLANSSIGVGAYANWLFNQNRFAVKFLKSRWLSMAITYVTIQSILSFKNYHLKLQDTRHMHDIMISHMSIVKNPHISGDLKFDQAITPDDGNLGLNYCENMSRRELINVMIDLKKGRFSGKPKRHSYFVTQLNLRPDEVIPVELDGEIEVAKEINYSLIPRGISVMQ